jgi:hypothetical protein
MGGMNADDWSADIEVVPTTEGRFVAVLVLRPPALDGEPIRTEIAGEYDSPLIAEMAAMDAIAAMTRD